MKIRILLSVSALSFCLTADADETNERAAVTYANRLVATPAYTALLSKSEASREAVLEKQAKTKLMKDLVTRGVPVEDLVPPSAGVYKEYQTARPFLLSLDTTERPPLEDFAALNVNSNPVAVLWSQVLLNYEGSPTQLSVPDDFRSLLFLTDIAFPEWPPRLAGLGSQYVDARMQEAVARAFLDASSKLTSSHFKKRYYDSTFDCRSPSIFWDAVLGYSLIMMKFDGAYATNHVCDLVLLRSDISRALWDPDWLVELQQACPSNRVWHGPLPDILTLAAQSVGNDTNLHAAVREKTWQSFRVVEIACLDKLDESPAGEARRVMEYMAAALRGYGACDEAHAIDPLERRVWMSAEVPSEGDQLAKNLHETYLRWSYFLKLLTHISNYRADPATMDLLCEMHRRISGNSNEAETRAGTR